MTETVYEVRCFPSTWNPFLIKVISDALRVTPEATTAMLQNIMLTASVDGVFRNISPEQIARSAGWEDDPDRFLSALLRFRILHFTDFAFSIANNSSRNHTAKRYPMLSHNWTAQNIARLSDFWGISISTTALYLRRLLNLFDSEKDDAIQCSPEDLSKHLNWMSSTDRLMFGLSKYGLVINTGDGLKINYW